MIVSELGKQILKDVSRSFYLSMRLLPKAMREPVSLAYLLARASDTLADTGDLDAGLRLEMLDGFARVLHGADRTAWLGRIEAEVVPRQRHDGEKALMTNMEGVLQWLAHMKPDEPTPGEGDSMRVYQAPDSLAVASRQHAAILEVMTHIIKGQRLDIERFELQRGFRFTLDAELEEYCYLVAGCVGEFWTEIGTISLPGFSRVDTARLKRWGMNYGKGLQLINILRDLPSDLQAGRCYLPTGDPSDPDSLLAESRHWRSRARQYLEEGQAYAQSLSLHRTRAATALPGLIGERTLDRMDRADWQELEEGVRISRAQVYRCVIESFFV